MAQFILRPSRVSIRMFYSMAAGEPQIHRSAGTGLTEVLPTDRSCDSVDAGQSNAACGGLACCVILFLSLMWPTGTSTTFNPTFVQMDNNKSVDPAPVANRRLGLSSFCLWCSTNVVAWAGGQQKP